MKRRFFPLFRPFAAGLVISAGLPMAGAATLYWDGTSTGPNANGGSGTWSADPGTLNWDTAATGGTDVAWATTSDAVFGGTGGVVTLSGDLNAASLTFQTAGYTLTGGSITRTGSFTVATGSHDVSIESTLKGVLSLTKTGTGVLTLSGTNNLPTFTVSEGTVKAASTGGFGPAGSSMTVSSGATADLNGMALGKRMRISGTGSGGAGAIVNNTGIASISAIYLNGPATVGGSQRWDIGAAPVPRIELEGHTLTKKGSGSLYLQVSTTTTGGFDVAEGTLWVPGNMSGAVNTFTIRTGASLGQTGAGSTSNRHPGSVLFETGSTWKMAGSPNNAFLDGRWDGPVNFSGNTTVDVTPGFTLTQNGIMSGSAPVTKTGGGAWILKSFSTHTGGVLVNDGKLVLGAANTTTGAAALAGGITVGTGTTLELAVQGALGTLPGQRISQVDVNGGTVDNTSNGPNSYGPINLRGGTLRSGNGPDSPTAPGYFVVPAGGQVTSLAAGQPSSIHGRLDLGPGLAGAPTPFLVESGGLPEDLRVHAAVTEPVPGRGVTKSGNGLMTLDGPAVYTGATTVQAGSLLLSTNGSLAASPVTVGSGARFGALAAGKSLASLSAGAGSMLVLPASTSSTTTIGGALDLAGGTVTIAPVLGAGSVSATYDLATAGSITGGGTPVLDLSGAYGATRATGSLAVNGNKLQLTLTGTGGNLVWNNATAAGTANGTWDTTLANFSMGGNTAAFQAFDSVTFDDSVSPGVAKTIALGTTLAPALLTVNNSSGDYTFTSPGGLAGAGSLVKTGSSALTISGPNGYGMTGDITAGGGILDFSGKQFSIGKFTLAGGGTVNQATISARSADFLSGTMNADLSVSGAWTKGSGATVQLSGDYNLPGPGNLTGGSLVLGNPLAPGNTGSIGSQPIHIDAGASLTLCRSDSPVIANTLSGAGTLNLTGSNDGANSESKFTLAADNSAFSGLISVSNGFLPVKTPQDIGSAAISMTGRLLLFVENSTLSNPLHLAPTGAWGHVSASTGNLTLLNATLTGPVQLGGGTTTRIYGRDDWPSGNILRNSITGPISENGGSAASVIIYVDTEGILALSGHSTYTGSTTIQSGHVNLTGSLGASAVTVGPSATLSGTGTIGTGGSLTLNGRLRTGLTGAALTVNGNVTLNTSKIVPDLSAASTTSGPVPILNYTGTLTGFNTLEMDDANLYRQAVFANPAGQVTLNIGGKALIWKGSSGNNWSVGGTKLWNTNGTGETESFYKGDRVTFDDTGVANVYIHSSGAYLEPAAVLFNNSSKNYTVSANITGSCKVTKQGSGSVSWGGTNSHTGGTAILMGRMEIGPHALGNGPVTVTAGATLGGDTYNTESETAATATIAGTVDPGTSGSTSPAALNLGPTVLSGTYQCQLDDQSDLLAVKGNLDLTGATLALNRTEPVLSEGLNFYTIATYTGTLTGWFSTVTGLPAEFEVVHDAANKRIIVKPFDFTRWMDGYASLSDTTANGDPDGDGVSNLLEFMLGGNPGSHETSLLPTFRLTDNKVLVSFKRRDASIYTTTQTVQWATDLAGPWTDPPLYWRTSYGYTEFSENGEAPTDVTVDLPRQPEKMFIRLKIEEK